MSLLVVVVKVTVSPGLQKPLVIQHWSASNQLPLQQSSNFRGVVPRTVPLETRPSPQSTEDYDHASLKNLYAVLGKLLVASSSDG